MNDVQDLRMNEGKIESIEELINRRIKNQSTIACFVTQESNRMNRINLNLFWDWDIEAYLVPVYLYVSKWLCS
jgi:hypothetical protein